MLFIILMFISHFVFCSWLIICYLFYIYFRLLEMRLDKKQIQAFFLTSKWIVKNQRQLVTSAMHLAQELLTNVQHGGCSRTFAKKGKALTMRSVVAGHQKLTVANWEPSLKPILLPLHERLPKNSVSTMLWSFGIWSKLERWKKLGKWVPLELTRSQKNHYLKVSSSLTVCNNSEPFFDQVVKCDEKWILCNSHQWPA